jgi:hypothetical protein
LWLLPAAISFVGFFDKIFSFGNALADLCRQWLGFMRNLWAALFGAMDGAVPVSLDTMSADLLTLWVTSSIAVWLLPIATRTPDGRLMTTVDAVGGLLRAPTVFARPIALVLIVLAIVTMLAPFGAFSSEQGSLFPGLADQSAIIGASGFGEWLSGQGVWAAAVLVLLAGVLYAYNFFAIGPRLANAVLSPAERRDLLIVAIVLWLVSALLLVLSLLVPTGATAAGFSKADVMVLSLLTLVGLVAWRTALPFVQLVVLAGAIFAIDAVYGFIMSVANAGGAG